ncbi:uncharacterized protein LY79DRAFT_380847 [Colletotrichum navitas]|uniref:Secreted protein n=1 Tax=Colletotrichum navitas TaxID=681940 RepID=A0AAD8Q7L4_9PEZI|nr:uncharacterized protein LY79DRAFT_380847 [Colletotrichum navitas]KAK1597307.1 hypothetical protein LY79DRAFT_380847 [Colletotrichum navitas]
MNPSLRILLFLGYELLAAAALLCSKQNISRRCDAGYVSYPPILPCTRGYYLAHHGPLRKGRLPESIAHRTPNLQRRILPRKDGGDKVRQPGGIRRCFKLRRVFGVTAVLHGAPDSP